MQGADLLRIELKTLDAAGIEDLLRQAGGKATSWADDPNLRVQVQRVSQGDPFYLHYLAEDIAAGRIGAQRIEQQPSGLKAYLNQWWQQLQEAGKPDENQHLQDLLSSLAVARGPLSRDDFARMYPAMAWGFERAIYPISRFLRASTGAQGKPSYTLSHDRFRDYLVSSALPPELLDGYCERLLAYCSKWREHRSLYALRFYPEHLREAQRYYELFALARDRDFGQAQAVAFPADPDLPLTLVQTALQCAMDADAAGEMAEFVLLHARLVQQTTQESPLAALRAGNLERAWQLADLFDAERRVLWYLLLAWELQDTGRVAEAEKTLRLLLHKKLPRLSPVWHYNWPYLLVPILDLSKELLSVLAEQLLDSDGYYGFTRAVVGRAVAQVRSGELGAARVSFTVAVDTAGRITDGYNRSQAFGQIAQAQAQAKDFAAALDTAALITGEVDRVPVLSAIAQAQAQCCELDAAQASFAAALNTAFAAALDSAKLIYDEVERVQAVSLIAQAQAQAGELHLARASFVKAFNIVDQISDDICRAMALNAIAEAQAQAKDFAAALDTVKRINRESDQADALSTIAKAQAQAGDVAAAIDTMSRMTDGYRREEVMSAIAEAQAQAGDFGSALDIAGRITDNRRRVEVLNAIAQAQALAGELEAAHSSFAAALDVAERIALNPSENEFRALRAIAQAQAQAKDFAEALDTAGRIIHPLERVRALNTVAETAAQAGELDTARTAFAAAFDVAAQIPWDYGRVEPLVEIAKTQVVHV